MKTIVLKIILLKFSVKIFHETSTLSNAFLGLKILLVFWAIVEKLGLETHDHFEEMVYSNEYYLFIK